MSGGVTEPVKKYELEKMNQLMENLKHNIYPEAEYLTGRDLEKGERFLTIETLNRFRVGVGEEKFYDSLSETWKHFPCVYFPMHTPLSEKASIQRFERTVKELKAMTKKDRSVRMEQIVAVETSEEN